MYSIALNTAYLLRTINILAAVTNRLFPDPVSKGIHHFHLLVQGGSEWTCLFCSWGLVIAQDTRMVTDYFEVVWQGPTAQASISLWKHPTPHLKS